VAKHRPAPPVVILGPYMARSTNECDATTCSLRGRSEHNTAGFIRLFEGRGDRCGGGGSLR
jgi:hypothetical protein